MRKPVLVVYFSRSGYTRLVASEIATVMGADTEELQEPAARSGMLGYFRSAREALRGTLPELRPAKLDPREYDLVVLGTPIWASHVCSPVRAYIAAHKNDLGQVAFFCTEGGSGARKVFREMSALCGRSPLATLELEDGEIDRRKYADKLRQFIAALGMRKVAA
jgi:flavodoxin